MLDAFIIEEIKRREQERERRRDSDVPSVQIPLPESDRAPQQSEEEKPRRGVIIIDYSMKSAVRSPQGPLAPSV